MSNIKFSSALKYPPPRNKILSPLFHLYLLCVTITLLSIITLIFYIETTITITIASDSTFLENYPEEEMGVLPEEAEAGVIDSEEMPYSNIGSMACHLPKLDPFDETVMRFHVLPDPVDCTSGHPLIFATDQDSNLIQVQDPSEYNFYNCCYSSFERKGSDLQITVNPECVPITAEVTEIPEGIQFIKVDCTNGSESSQIPVDLFGIIKPITSKKENILQPNISESPGAIIPGSREVIEPEPIKKFNVVVLGLDSLSHMNFIRVMPRTHAYITQNLSALSFSGYVKVGDNTFPNLASILTGKSVEELNDICWKDRLTDHFDECPFIWKNYSSRGYRTAFGEDAVWFGAFTYCKEGFINQPTDYYYNPLTLHLEKFLGHTRVNQMTLCYGPRLGGDVLLDYLEKLAHTMNQTNENYFQFVWATSTFHGNLCQGAIGDESVLKTLQWFEAQGHLEQTVFALMSDHGMRWGDIRSTLQGRLEENMPFLYLLIPRRFQEQFPLAAKNLIENQNKLTTHFDLHETLQDLSDLGNIFQRNVLRGSLFDKDLPRGISLFSPIPARRTCKDAGISEQWCVCDYMKPIQVENNTLVWDGASNVLQHINAMFTQHQNCSTLSLQRVLNAQVILPGLDKPENEDEGIWEITSSDDPKLTKTEITLTIAFSVHPSNGTFEATITRRTHGNWTITDEISRTNLYGDQSACVDAYQLKKFCYCELPK